MTVYTKTTWNSGVAPGISAANLNNLETQYDDAVSYCDAKMPSGAIIMWAGTIASIPSGWVICDGNNSTPNLLGRFIEGVATAATNPGTTGGATAKTTAGHTHAGPSHTHGYPGDRNLRGSTPETVNGQYTYDGGAETFNDHTSASGTNSTSSSTDGIADIRPKYYDLAFIMKT